MAVEKKISFIILTWNSQEHIKPCVESIVADLEETPFLPEIFIVDNGSTDRTMEAVQSLESRYSGMVHPISLGKNFGTTYPRNLALGRATGEFLCVLDSDIEIQSPCLSQLVSSLAGDERAGIVVPRLTYPNGKLQKSTDRFPTLARKFERYFFLRKMEDQEQVITGASRVVDYAISAFWFFRAELLDRVGYLDERFFYAPEDVDYCLRVWKGGLRVVYCPQAQAVHHTQELSRGLRFNRALVEHLKGLAYYFYKHGYLFRRPLFHP